MARTITVGTQAELLNALKTASGGDTIALKSGDYGNLSLIDRSTFDLSFTSTVTIKAADAGNPPVVTGLDVRNASNLSFQDIVFDYVANPGAPLWNLPFRVSGGNDISFKGCTFDGDIATGLTAVDNGYPTGQGLALSGINGVSVIDSEFINFYKGMSVGGSSNVVVTGNEIHQIRMDGMVFSSDTGVLIENNHIHNFMTSPLSADHSDMIQFWTTGGKIPSTDIVIRGNTLDIGDGGLTQSIFMRNELVDTGRAGTEMYYRNVLIENNVIVNGHLHGITVGETNGLVIKNNSVLHSDGNTPDGLDPVVEIPRINVSADSTNVTIVQNATKAIAGYSTQADWIVKNNAFVQDQDPNAPGWYGDVFVTSSLTAQNGLHDFLSQPDSMLVKLGAGALATRTNSTTTLDANFNILEKANDLHTMTFDASASTGPQPAGTTYLWSFGDGSTATGKTVSHSFADGGHYDVKLIVKLANGTSDAVLAKVTVENPLVVKMGDNGGFFASSAGKETFINSAMPIDRDGNLQLGGTGAQAKIERVNLERIFGQDNVAIDFRLRTDAPGNTGEIFRLNSSLQASVTTSGAVEVKVWSSLGGAVVVTSGDLAINDGKFHDVKMDLDNGKLALLVDGVKVKEVPFLGTIVDPGNMDLTFGTSWAKNLQGDLDTFSITMVDETPLHTPSTSSVLDTPLSLLAPINDVQPAVTAEVAPTVPDILLTLKSNGDFAAFNAGKESTIKIDPTVLSNGDLQLSGARKSVATIDDTFFDRMFDSKDVTVSFRIAADKNGETGEIFRIHDSLIATINSQGEMQVKVYAKDGGATLLSSTGVKINDGGFHDVDLHLEGGKLSLVVDNKPTQSTDFSGTIKDGGNYDMTFGSSWAGNNFAGDLDTFQISLGLDPLSAHALSIDAPLI